MLFKRRQIRSLRFDDCSTCSVCVNRIEKTIKSGCMGIRQDDSWSTLEEVLKVHINLYKSSNEEILNSNIFQSCGTVHTILKISIIWSLALAGWSFWHTLDLVTICLLSHFKILIAGKAEHFPVMVAIFLPGGSRLKCRYLYSISTMAFEDSFIQIMWTVKLYITCMIDCTLYV